MSPEHRLPELDGLRHPSSVIRVPDCQDVPVTSRVQRIIDTAPVRRLASISQLGMVALVYPGATYNRLEHSLGVYHYALRLLDRFSDDDRLDDPVVAESFLLAALLHDVGHWPFCHPIEDMRLSGLGEHESRAVRWMRSPDLADCLEEDWSCDADRIAALLTAPADEPTFSESFFRSCLSGPIDVDKLDYLQRDSLHAGVPYGRNFDAGRLVHAMVVHPDKPKLAISEKGRTAAEMMVFARYVMFSEVYWHHAVRSATAMLQRAVFLLRKRFDLESSFRLTDHQWIAMIRQVAGDTEAASLVEGLFGPRRTLHKRLIEFDVIDGVDLHMRLARRPFWWLVACAEKVAEILTVSTGIAVPSADILIDAPPVKLEVDINIDVVRRDGSVRALEQLSPVASALARQQFDHHVKRVRVFVRPELKTPLMQSLRSMENLEALIDKAIAEVEDEIV